eukprot:4490201-Pyramimonas_sp.AAC.1
MLPHQRERRSIRTPTMRPRAPRRTSTPRRHCARQAPPITATTAPRCPATRNGNRSGAASLASVVGPGAPTNPGRPRRRAAGARPL